MSRVCMVTGKKPVTGNNVSHANNKTRRRFGHRLGAQWIHNVQVTSGNRTNPHPHLSSDRLLQPGDIIFMDVVCLFNGYHTCVYR